MLLPHRHIEPVMASVTHRLEVPWVSTQRLTVTQMRDGQDHTLMRDGMSRFIDGLAAVGIMSLLHLCRMIRPTLAMAFAAMLGPHGANMKAHRLPVAGI